MSARVVYVVDDWIQSSQTFIRDEVAELRRQGAQVELIALGRGDLAPGHDEPATYLSDLVVSRPARALALARRPAAALRLARCQAAMRPERIHYRAALPSVAEALQAEQVEWVHAHFGWEAAGVAEALANILGVGWSFTAHANDVFVANRHLAGRLARADHLVTVCRYNLAELRAAHDRLPPTEVIVCGAVVPPPPERGVDDFDVDVLAVGRLVEKKGFDVLLEAVATLRSKWPGLTVELVGDGPQLAELRELADRNGLSSVVQLVGAQPHARVLDRMARARIVCLPARIASDGDRDSMPVVLKEAMARRVPVVAGRVGGIPELVDDSVGRLVPPDDPASLAEALDEILADPALATRLGDAGRARIEAGFTLTAEVERLRRCFETWPAYHLPS